MRIAVICNDRLALLALSQLIKSRLVVSVGTTNRVNEIQLLVKQICAQEKVPLQTFSKKNFAAEMNNWLQLHTPDVVLVKTFPWLIASQFLNIPKYGFINFHYAPLPEWRGSNPLFWMIRNRASIAGVSVHYMTEEYDTGDILLQQEIPLSSETTFGLLCTQLAYLGLELSAKLLQQIQANTLKAQPQDSGKARFYNRPKQSDLFIDWNTMSAEDVKALTKACNPWNKGAATRGNGWTFGITDVSIHTSIAEENILPGTILELSEEKGLIIACKNKQSVKVNVMYCEEGFYGGQQLAFFGFKKGNRLGN